MEPWTHDARTELEGKAVLAEDGRQRNGRSDGVPQPGNALANPSLSPIQESTSPNESSNALDRWNPFIKIALFLGEDNASFSSLTRWKRRFCCPLPRTGEGQVRGGTSEAPLQNLAGPEWKAFGTALTSFSEESRRPIPCTGLPARWGCPTARPGGDRVMEKRLGFVLIERTVGGHLRGSQITPRAKEFMTRYDEFRQK